MVAVSDFVAENALVDKMVIDVVDWKVGKLDIEMVGEKAENSDVAVVAKLVVEMV